MKISTGFLIRILFKILRKLLLIAGVTITTIYFVWAFESRKKDPLRFWHKIHPKKEFHVHLMEKDFSFSTYLKNEKEIFQEIKQQIETPATTSEPQPLSRYDRQSHLNPQNDPKNWNETFELIPNKIKGGVLLLHGLSDSPYSLRKIGQIFHRHGFYVLGLRVPGHGTLPSGLLDVTWRDWMAAVRLASNHLRQKIREDQPFYIAGYSNGGALAVNYTLDAINNPDIPGPQKLFLFSPAIGITFFARFASTHKLISFLPAFQKFKWLDIDPEYDPYKYNSFTKNAGTQSSNLARRIQKRIEKLKEKGQFKNLPPMITFQSVVDDTVVGLDAITKLYDPLEEPESELVLFDINRSIYFETLVRDKPNEELQRIKGQSIFPYRLTVITNKNNQTSEVVALTKESGSAEIVQEKLAMHWPEHVYSLSHVAIPFPSNDSLYGQEGNIKESKIPKIGSWRPRGERKVLKIPASQFMRIRYNPFFAYIEKRIEEELQEVGAQKP